MFETRKKPRRHRSSDDLPELTSIEKIIGKYLRFQCPTKKGMLMGMQVVYFNGTKAVECLIESKWSSISSKSANNGKNPICFSSKHDAVQMLRKYLDQEMFRRVIKVYKDQTLPLESVDDISQSNTVRQRKNKTTTESLIPTVETTNDDDSKDKSKKKKFKFEMHDEQVFLDSTNDFYVWIYSPNTIKQYLIGGLLVIGCIGVCLFPLWPMQVRTGVYYLSIVTASLLGALLSLAVVKYIIFAMIWFVTMGKIKFWLLPNLTEDVGFVESFIPLFTINQTANDEKKKKKEVLINIPEDEEKQSIINRSDADDEEQRRQKLVEEGFEVLSKDELESK